jgi:hypothetical protein
MIPGIGFISPGPGDFTGWQLNGSNQAAHRLHVNGQFLPLFAGTWVHNRNKSFDG